MFPWKRINYGSRCSIKITLDPKKLSDPGISPPPPPPPLHMFGNSRSLCHGKDENIFWESSVGRSQGWVRARTEFRSLSAGLPIALNKLTDYANNNSNIKYLHCFKRTDIWGVEYCDRWVKLSGLYKMLQIALFLILFLITAESGPKLIFIVYFQVWNQWEWTLCFFEFWWSPQFQGICWYQVDLQQTNI